MSNQVVMVRAVLVSPDSSKTMRPVFLGACFSDHAPLNRDVFIVIEREYFIGAPTGGHMIQNDVLPVSSAQGVTLVIRSDSEIPNDDIIGIDGEVAFERDPVPRSRLPGKGDVIVLDLQVTVDGARYAEDDDARPLGSTCRAQAAGSGRVEVGHVGLQRLRGVELRRGHRRQKLAEERLEVACLRMAEEQPLRADGAGGIDREREAGGGPGAQGVRAEGAQPENKIARVDFRARSDSAFRAISP